MANKIFFRRFVALLLCCVLVGSSFARSAFASDPVTAASLAITGGQLAGAGLSGEAALSLAGPVGAVVGVTLGALGINAYVSQAAQEAGKTRTRFVLDKLVIWGAQAGYTQEQLYSKIAQGISVAADGTIQLGKDAAEVINQFGNWLVSVPDTVVPDPNPPSNSTDFTFGDYTFSTTTGVLESIGGQKVQWHSGGSIFIANAGTGSGQNPHVCSFEPATFYYYGGTGVGWFPSPFQLSSYLTNAAGVKLYYYGLNSSAFPDTSYVVPDAFYRNFSGSIDTPVSSVPQAYDEVFVGTPEAWAENKDVLNPASEDTPIVLNPDLLNPIIDSLTDGQQATMSIIDYLEALQDAWDHALDDAQTAIGTITDTLTGIQEQIAVPQDAVANPTVTNPSLTPDTTPILNPSDIDPGTVVTGLSFDLTQIFPFCIPFDIYDMLATLSATPEAPVYHVHYEGPYNIVIDFTVDLTPWDSVAAVLRTVELLAFCIGLAYVTRSMFIRS